MSCRNTTCKDKVKSKKLYEPLLRSNQAPIDVQ